MEGRKEGEGGSVYIQLRVCNYDGTDVVELKRGECDGDSDGVGTARHCDDEPVDLLEGHGTRVLHRALKGVDMII